MAMDVGRLQWTPLGLCAAMLAASWLVQPPGIGQAAGGVVAMLALSWVGALLLRRALRNAAQTAADALAALDVQCQQQRTVLNNLPFPVWFKDAQGLHLLVNQAYVERLQQSGADAVVGKTDFELWPAALAQRFRDDDVQIMQSGEACHVEMQQGTSPDGGWDEIFKTPVRYGLGQWGTVGVGIDITLRKQTEARLHLLGAALDRVGDAVCLVPFGSTALVYVNATMCLTLGYSQAELTGGMTLFDIDPLVKTETLVGLWAELKAQGSTRFESMHRPRHGADFAVEVCANYFLFDGLEYSLATARNIEDRQALQKRLTDSEQQFRGLTENITDLILCLDAQGRRVYLNPAGQRWYRKVWGSDGDVLDPATTMLDPGTRTLHDAIVAQVLATGQEEQLEFTSPLGDGLPSITAIARYMPQRNAQGDIEGVIIVGRDVTALKRDEANLRRLNRALTLTNATNLAVAKARTLQDLLDAVCRQMVELGGYITVCIGRAETDARKTVTLVAGHGSLAAGMFHLSHSWDAAEPDFGAMGRSIAQGTPVLVADVQTDPRVLTSPGTARTLGVRSMLCLPLHGVEQVWGRFTPTPWRPTVFRMTKCACWARRPTTLPMASVRCWPKVACGRLSWPCLSPRWHARLPRRPARPRANSWPP